LYVLNTPSVTEFVTASGAMFEAAYE